MRGAVRSDLTSFMMLMNGPESTHERKVAFVMILLVKGASLLIFAVGCLSEASAADGSVSAKSSAPNTIHSNQSDLSASEREMLIDLRIKDTSLKEDLIRLRRTLEAMAKSKPLQE